MVVKEEYIVCSDHGGPKRLASIKGTTGQGHELGTFVTDDERSVNSSVSFEPFFCDDAEEETPQAKLLNVSVTVARSWP